jgi:hypothetical protein
VCSGGCIPSSYDVVSGNTGLWRHWHQWLFGAHPNAEGESLVLVSNSSLKEQTRPASSSKTLVTLGLFSFFQAPKPPPQSSTRTPQVLLFTFPDPCPCPVSDEGAFTALQTLVKATVGFEEGSSRDAIFTCCKTCLADLSACAKPDYILTGNWRI